MTPDSILSNREKSVIFARLVFPAYARQDQGQKSNADSNRGMCALQNPQECSLTVPQFMMSEVKESRSMH